MVYSQVKSVLPIDNDINGRTCVHVFMVCGHSKLVKIASWNTTKLIPNMPRSYFKEENIKCQCHDCVRM